MPTLFFSENDRPGAALSRSLSQASQYATLLPTFYSSPSSFSSNTEHLLQVGKSNLKHLYLVPMKQEWLSHIHHAVRCQQWLWLFSRSLPQFCAQAPRAPFGHHGGRECIPGPVAKLSLYSTCSSGGKIAFGRWGSMYFCDVCPVHHIWINYYIWMENSSLSRFRRDSLLSLVIALGERSVEGIRSCQQSMIRRVLFL